MAIKVTTKKPLVKNLRSKALNATKTMQKPNLQNKIVNGIKIKTSARELKTLNKRRNIKVSSTTETQAAA